MNEKTLNKVHLRAIQYWFEDGLAELGLGGFFLLLGLYFYLQTTLKNDFLLGLLAATFLLIFLGGWYLTGRFVRAAKEKITFPRTGYVAYKSNPKRHKPLRLALAMLVSALISAGLIGLNAQRPLGLDLLPAATGLGMAIVLGLIGFRTRLPRFYLPALFGLLCGISLTLSGYENLFGIALLYLACALVLGLSGTIVFSRYLRTHPAPSEASDDQ